MTAGVSSGTGSGATASPFAVRGVVEGFYGRPWSHEQRLDLIGFLADRGMNTFVYSPKDDPLIRHRWRAPYRDRARARLAELIGACAGHGVDLVFCLSPGLTIRYSSQSDLAALLAKYDDVASLGVQRFGLLVDDIPAALQHPEDLEAFDDLVTAQIALATAVFRHLTAADPRAGLIVCPTQYWGTGEEESVRRLGAELDPRIDLFWTGRAICAPAIELGEAARVMRGMNRPPTYWDNYPVNDVAMAHELHLGPYLGRDRHLYRFARGVVANAMELAECSKIPLATVMDYLADPEGYDPEASWQRAILDVAGPELAADVAVLADCVRGSCLDGDDAPMVSGALAAFAFRRSVGDDAGAARGLAAVAGQVGGAVDRLLAVLGQGVLDGLLGEARPWLAAAGTGARAMAALADHVAAGSSPSEIADTAEEYLLALRSNGKRVFGDALVMTLTDAVDLGRNASACSPQTDTSTPRTTPQEEQ